MIRKKNIYNLIESCLGISLSQSMLNMKQILIQDFESSKLDLSFEDWMNLYQLQIKDGITQNQLAKILGKDKTTISRMVDNWRAKGWVIKSKNKIDTRIMNLSLSKLGSKLHLKGCKIILRRDKDFVSCFSNKDLGIFIQLLSKLNLLKKS